VGLTVSVSHPAFPDEQEFGIDHLGVVPNNGSLEVPEENERSFITVNGMTVEDAFKGNGVVSVSGSSSVDDPQELIGDRQAPGPEQGVVTPEEQQEEQGKNKSVAPAVVPTQQVQEEKEVT